MMTCKEVATHLSNEGSERRSLVKRLSMAMHLAMCRNCRAFARQLAWLKRTSRQLGDALVGDLPASFEERLQERLTRREEDRETR